jgi:hypothetical protein
MASAEDAQDVLVVIGLHEDSDLDCDNQLIDRETGLDPGTVDAVLDQLWRDGRIEAIRGPGERSPSVVKVRRVLPDREPLWGDDGTYKANQSA